MSMTGETKHQAGGSPLEVFVGLAKAATGAEAVELVKQALDANGVYTFTELIEVPSIQQLAGGEFSVYWDLLQLFAYGTYKDYASKGVGGFPELSVHQKKKLQHLTIITLSELDKCIPYKTLLEELGIANVRELEDLIIEAIYSEIIQGKLDQRRALLEVDTTIGRDIRKQDIATVSSTLESWCDACENVLSTLQTQVDKANSERSRKIQRKDDLEQQINNLKKTIKHQSQDGDESYANDSREALGIGVDKTPKKALKKGGRGRGYFK